MDYTSPSKENNHLDNSQLSPIENCRGNSLSPLNSKKRSTPKHGTVSPTEIPHQSNPRTPASTTQSHRRPLNADQSNQKEISQQENQESRQVIDSSAVKFNSLESENDASTSLHQLNAPNHENKLEDPNLEDNTFGIHTIPRDPEDSPKKSRADSNLHSSQNSHQKQLNSSVYAPSTQKKLDKSRLSFSSVGQSLFKSDEKSSNNLLSHLENQAAFSRTVDLLTSAAKNLLPNREEISKTAKKSCADKMTEETPDRSQRHVITNDGSIQRNNRLLETDKKQSEAPIDGIESNGLQQNSLFVNEGQTGEPSHTASKNTNLMEEEKPETQSKYNIDLGDDALLTHNTPLVKHQPLQSEAGELDAISRNLENESTVTKDNSESAQNETVTQTGTNKTSSTTSKVNTSSTSRFGGLTANLGKTQPRFGARDQKLSLPTKMNTSQLKTDCSASAKQRTQSFIKNLPSSASRKIGSAVSGNSVSQSLIKKRTRDQIAKSVEKEENPTKNAPQIKKAKLTLPAAPKTSLNHSFQGNKPANIKKVEPKLSTKNSFGKPKVNPAPQSNGEQKENIPKEGHKPAMTKTTNTLPLKTPKATENISKKLPTCEICKKELKVFQTRTLGCSHKFHTDCYIQSSKKKPGCPLCNGTIKSTPNQVLTASIKA